MGVTWRTVEIHTGKALTPSFAGGGSDLTYSWKTGHVARQREWKEYMLMADNDGQTKPVFSGLEVAGLEKGGLKKLSAKLENSTGCFFEQSFNIH